MCLSFHPKDVAGLHIIMPGSVWKALAQSSVYSLRVTSKEWVFTAGGTLELCDVFSLCPGCLLK